MRSQPMASAFAATASLRQYAVRLPACVGRSGLADQGDEGLGGPRREQDNPVHIPVANRPHRPRREPAGLASPVENHPPIAESGGFDPAGEVPGDRGAGHVQQGAVGGIEPPPDQIGERIRRRPRRSPQWRNRSRARSGRWRRRPRRPAAPGAPRGRRRPAHRWRWSPAAPAHRPDPGADPAAIRCSATARSTPRRHVRATPPPTVRSLPVGG